LLAVRCAAAFELQISPADERVDPRRHALYYDDPTRTMTLAQALAAADRFLPADRRVPRLDGAVHWLRLPLANVGATDGRWLLSLGLPDAENLEAWRVGGGRAVTLAALAADADFTARPVPERLLAVPVELAPGERTELFLRYRTHGETPLTLELLSPERFRKQLAAGNLWNGVVIGLLLALTLLALLQYLALGQTAFLAYVGLGLLMVGFLLEFEGYNFEYLWPNHGAWNQAVPVCLAAGINIAHSLFTLALFDLRRSFPQLYRVYLGYLALPPLSLALYLGVGWIWPALLSTLAYVPLAFTAGLFFLRHRLPAAGFFLAAAASYILFTNILFGLSVFGFVSSGPSPFVYPKIGYVSEAVFFAMALARQTQALRRRLEDGLRRHLAEAEQLVQVEAEKNRALLAAQQQQLQLAAAGHDLSQPLASIRFALAALRAEAGNEAATRHIDQALDYTEALLRALIDDAKRGYADRRQVLCLGDALADVRRRHLAAAEGKGLRLRCRPNACRIDGSELVLGRILDNLVGNAVRYTERGQILLGVRRRADGLEVQVLDSGPGFDTARRQRLLAPFEQGGTLAAERLGYGLGLHIVHALCAEAGYRLDIRSTPGRGSTFGVLIPFRSCRERSGHRRDAMIEY
jgi:signal transduction histidine kinase